MKSNMKKYFESVTSGTGFYRMGRSAAHNRHLKVPIATYFYRKLPEWFGFAHHFIFGHRYQEKFATGAYKY
jgi:hypothetical protein